MIKENKLNSKKILKEIENKKPQLKEKGVKKIGIFGSYAKDKQKKKSDVDILVVLENPTFDSYMDLKFLLEKLFRKKVDLVMEESLKPELEYVKKEAKYARL
ncbi:nucleotidyltransferase domain-containing protein [Candidatus Pacearchaeota archaeon]|nr:nucleotidyltransferase domain-containing protein [Candidatus Pacearchaeota archaeon]